MSMAPPAALTLRTRLSDGLARRPLLLIAAGVVLYSTGPVLVAGSHVSGAVLSFWRLWIGVLVLGLFLVAPMRTPARRPGRDGWTIAVRCGVVFGLHQLLFMTAVKRTSVIDVTLMQLLAPVIVGALAAVMFGERPGARFRIWSLVSLAGAVVVVAAGAGGPRGDPVGVAIAAGNVVCFAVYFVGSKRARSRIDTTAFLFAAIATAAVIAAAFLVATGEPVTGIAPSDLVIAALLALFPGGLGHVVTTWQLHRVPANIPPVMQLAMPFLAGGLAWVFLGQGVGALQVAGGLVTLAGVAGALRSRSGLAPVVAEPKPDILGTE